MSLPSILVVHADADVSAALCKTLESNGLQVRTAADGLAGLSAAEQDPPRAILMDTMLPRLDGLSLIQSLRSSPDTRDIPVIILSGRVEPSSAHRGFAAGARYCLTLPFQPADLLAKVRRLLDETDA